jgi:HAD superfamily hydrolase (TIGR01490 family)
MNAGSQVGAFFDIDRTLLAAPSLEWRFIAYLLARDKIGIEQIGRWAAHCAQTMWHKPHAALDANKFYLSGLPESLAMDWENSLVPDSIKCSSLPIFAEGFDRISWHSARGDCIFLVTGTIEPLARAFVRILARHGLECCAQISATQLETRDVFWTGRIAGEHMSGAEKAIALHAFAARYGLALAESYAYGDSFADLPMLKAVGHPVAVNPQARLARIAGRRGWAVCHWRSLQSDEAAAQSRALASEGSS